MKVVDWFLRVNSISHVTGPHKYSETSSSKGYYYCITYKDPKKNKSNITDWVFHEKLKPYLLPDQIRGIQRHHKPKEETYITDWSDFFNLVDKIEPQLKFKIHLKDGRTTTITYEAFEAFIKPELKKYIDQDH